MLPTKLPSISAFAGAASISLWAWVQSPSNRPHPPVDSSATYLPLQSISYVFGSKTANGHFAHLTGACLVALMIGDAGGPGPLPSPTRLRVILQPGQTAGLDSEEGRSLNLTCGDDAKTLLVDAGAREQLVALQARTMPSYGLAREPLARAD